MAISSWNNNASLVWLLLLAEVPTKLRTCLCLGLYWHCEHRGVSDPTLDNRGLRAPPLPTGALLRIKQQWSGARSGVRFEPAEACPLPWRCCRCWAHTAGWCSADSRWRRSHSAAPWNGTRGSRSGPFGCLHFPASWSADRWSTWQPRGTSWRAHSCQCRRNPGRGFADLRDKQIKEGGVGGMRVDRCVASVQEHKVPVEKEWGPQHRVRDSRSQVESSNFAIYQDGAMRSEAKGEIGKKKQRQPLIHTWRTSGLDLNLSNHSKKITLNPQGRAGLQIYF